MVDSTHENLSPEIFLTMNNNALYNVRICKQYGHMNSLAQVKMALLRYLQRRDSLPDPKGSLLSAIPAQAIARANQEVLMVAENIQIRERGK